MTQTHCLSSVFLVTELKPIALALFPREQSSNQLQKQMLPREQSSNQLQKQMFPREQNSNQLQ